MILKRVGIGSAAKLSGAMYGGMGLVFGFVFALVSLFGMGMAQLANQSGDGPPAWVAPLFGVGAIFILPLFYGVLGAIVGAVGAGLYNLFARWIGGLVVELE